MLAGRVRWFKEGMSLTDKVSCLITKKGVSLVSDTHFMVGYILFSGDVQALWITVELSQVEAGF